MPNLAEFLPAERTATRPTNHDPLLQLWPSLGANVDWLPDMTHGVITSEEVKRWQANRCIPDARRALVADAFRVLLEDAETLLGREAVRRSHFATSPQFFAWSARLRKVRREFETLAESGDEA